MMSLTFGLFTQVSGSGPLGPLVKHTDRLLSVAVLCIQIQSAKVSVRYANTECKCEQVG